MLYTERHSIEFKTDTPVIKEELTTTTFFKKHL